jgi:hypothetical protein
MLTKTLKTRLQKFIDAVPEEDFIECWKEFTSRMKLKEQRIASGFNVGDEVCWDDKSGVILKINKTTCSVREDNSSGTRWTISSSMLKKGQFIK